MDACEEIAHSSILYLIKLACGQVSVACNALCNLEKKPIGSRPDGVCKWKTSNDVCLVYQK